MSKLAVLKLDGDFEQGFLVTLQIGAEGASPSLATIGRLPPNPNIPKQYLDWQLIYLSRSGQQLRLGAPAQQLKNFSISEFNQTAELLINSINVWLRSEPFRPIREKMLSQLNSADEVRLIIQNQDIQVRRLPWHFWEFFEDYTKAEVAISTPAYQRPENSAHLRKQLRILAILGNSDGINIEADRAFLNNLRDAETVFLVEPNLREVEQKLWDNLGWDILFFAGHSESGRIFINQNDSLEIRDLKYALKKAIAQGLHLAIFNSCDGLGLAPEQVDLQIPQIIVMRESVPDFVAQEFLKNFLQAFASGKSLYTSVREAREKLQGLEKKFPSATWLPVICQNPAVTPLTWQQLLGFSEKTTTTTVDGTWRCIHTLAGHADAVRTVAISPDGEILASGSRDNTIKLWHLSTGNLLRTLTGHTSSINWIAFSPDGKNLASASVFNPIKLWDWQTGELLRDLKDDFWIHWSPECGAFSPDGKILASGYNDTTIKLWDWRTGKLHRTLKAHTAVVSAVAFSSVEQTLVSCSRDNTIKIWNLRTGEAVHNLNAFSGFMGAVVAFSKTSVKELTNVFNHEFVHGLCALAISPDGKTIATGGDNNQPIQLWRLDTGELLGRLMGHIGDVHCLANSPHESLLVSGGDDKTIRIWDWRNIEMVYTLQQHSDTVYSVAFSPDGQTLVSGSKDRTIKIWRLSSNPI